MGKIISVSLPQDLPENWTETQYVSPGGTEVGLSEKHGYNYLMKQVNAAQKAAEELDAGVEKVLYHTGYNAITPTTTGCSTLFEYIKSMHTKGIVRIIAKINGFPDIPRLGWGYLMNAYNSEADMWDVQITEAVNNRMFMRQLNVNTKWIRDTWSKFVLSPFDDELVFSRPDAQGSSRILKNNSAEADYGFSIRDSAPTGAEARINVVASEQMVSVAFREPGGELKHHSVLHGGNFTQMAAPAGLVKSFKSVSTESEINSAIDVFVADTKDNGQETFLLEVKLSGVIPSDLYFITVRKHMSNYVTVTGSGVISATENTVQRRKVNGVWTAWTLSSGGTVIPATIE